MANKKNILVKTDQNNLIFIDPVSEVDSSGNVKGRNINHEELVMYVNLEADLIPRTTMIMGDNSSTLTSVAKGMFNMLHNKNGENLDTTWTESYTTNDNMGDGSGQSFGIDSIQIKTSGTNFVPYINIKFIDVRGKTLFDSPENSPYKTFFHLPWPIFYLTVKGYYGKAIRYRLHMIKFSTHFNSNNGNFEIDTTFVGSTYAYLNDIPLKGILNAPYMFALESEGNTTYNENTGKYTKKINKTSKGYQTLRSVYDEYISKGLIDNDFPIKTLRELVISAGRLDTILEKEIFNRVIDPKVLASINEYEKNLQSLEDGVVSWKIKRLSNEVVTYDGIDWNKLSDKNKNNYDFITGSTGTLEQIVKGQCEALYKNIAFGKTPLKMGEKFKKSRLTNSLSTISLDKILKITDYVRTVDGTVLTNIDGLLNDIYEIQKIFKQREKLIKDDIEYEMNNIIGNKNGDTNSTFGFKPTIRNIIAVILANADTYIRLMKTVHQNAFNVSEERKKLIKSYKTDSVGDDIYPWPEIKKQSSDGKVDVLSYPGSLDVVNKLKSYDSRLWPEIEFVENFLQVSTYKSDPLTEKEINPELIEYSFEDSTNNSVNVNNINLYGSLTNVCPYNDKSYTSILYEIYERAYYSMSLLPFNDDSIIELAKYEFDNIKNSLKNDSDLLNLLKINITNTKYSGTSTDNVYIYNLINTMGGTSTYDRYPYFQNNLPTTSYISSIDEYDFGVNQDTGTTKNINTYDKLEYFLKNYPLDKTEQYRTSIYPFNSQNYLQYIGQTEFKRDNLKLNGIVSTKNYDKNFISSVQNSKMWLKNGYVDNNYTIFDNNLYINGNNTNILNTPYFHKQLYHDFLENKSENKYVGSAYLLLNSLPFVDLSDNVTYNGKNVLVSTIFREIGAVHKIPYHLMVKWGSIYHRYKKYLLDNVDIIENVTNPIDSSLFFDNNNVGREYSGYSGNNIWTEKLTDNNIVGFYPYYQDIFHQIVNDYLFFDYSDTGTTSGFTNTYNIGANKSYITPIINGNLKTHTSFIDSTPYNSGVKKYSGETFTILPSNGKKMITGGTYNDLFQDSFRILWGTGNEVYKNTPIYSGYTFPQYNEYHNNVTGSTYSMDNNYKKVIDLIATFKPDILDVFEDAFLEFSSERMNVEMSYKKFNVPYNNFQDLLTDIVLVTKNNNETTIISDLINVIIKRQNSKLKTISDTITSDKCLINLVMTNPREINNHVLGSFTNESEIISDFGTFNTSQDTLENRNLLKLYVGDYIDNGTNHLFGFFSENNIEFNEENMKMFRPLIYIYAGMKIDGINTDFVTYLKNNINPNENIYITNSKLQPIEFGKINIKTKKFLNYIFNELNGLQIKTDVQSDVIQRSYNDDHIKLELYNYFKSFNDKWVAGNSLGQRTLMEEFLFLDKANKDIGDLAYIDMSKLIPIMDKKNSELNLYSTLILLLENTGFDVRALPAYVNFYGTNFNRTKKIKSSKDVAKNIFGTFLDVDTEESSPKIILQYFGPTSKILEMGDIDKKIKFKGDGVNIGEVNNNPIMVSSDAFKTMDYYKSNRAVAFEVSIGDQHQTMFKSVDLDQTSIRNTTESFDVIERLGSSAAGSATSQVDIGLFDIYRQASYQCTVTSMGNMMIQPTMFFYLKNVPLFRGSYWISEVTHSINSSGIDTTFKGTRIPMQSLPNPQDSFMASYRALFDRMISKATIKTNTVNNNSGSEKLLEIDGVSYYYDMGTGYTNTDETIVKQSGRNIYGINYNGFDGETYVQKIKYNSKNWLRGVAVKMGGENYNIDDNINMSILSNLNEGKITWADIKNSNQNYYSARFMERPLFISNNLKTTYFLNPQNKKTVTVNTDLSVYNKKYNGPVNVGPLNNNYGVGLSPSLMGSLGLKEGDIVYFNFDDLQ